MIQRPVLAFLLASASIASAQAGFPNVTMKPFGEALSHAEDIAVLHSKHTPAYHLKATIAETTNPQSEYRAEIEEFYQSEKNWRRTVTAPGLSWVEVTLDGRLQEQYSGDYAPFWLRGLLDGATDPLPQPQELERVQTPLGIVAGPHASSCMRGLPGALQVCIEGEHGAFNFISTDPGGIEFHDYAPFHKQWIARRLISNPESGTTLQLSITELSDLSGPMPMNPITPNATPLSAREVAQAAEQPLLKSDAGLHWPPVHGGKATGTVKVFVGIGPDGKVREVWPDGSDNSDMESFARAAIKDWQFAPCLWKGEPVAVSVHWSLPFEIPTSQ